MSREAVASHFDSLSPGGLPPSGVRYFWLLYRFGHLQTVVKGLALLTGFKEVGTTFHGLVDAIRTGNPPNLGDDDFQSLTPMLPYSFRGGGLW